MVAAAGDGERWQEQGGGAIGVRCLLLPAHRGEKEGAAVVRVAERWRYGLLAAAWAWGRDRLRRWVPAACLLAGKEEEQGQRPWRKGKVFCCCLLVGEEEQKGWRRCRILGKRGEIQKIEREISQVPPAAPLLDAHAAAIPGGGGPPPRHQAAAGPAAPSSLPRGSGGSGPHPGLHNPLSLVDQAAAGLIPGSALLSPRDDEFEQRDTSGDNVWRGGAAVSSPNFLPSHLDQD
ncbi:hypothetical protein U9M48_030766 [Paspalum notatum var. saurae]|uniref:Uncharacterized protein n=1 Tax=Paspalum notatum var. saurae TaxID=547442 RepID=A0AAQ3X2L8_PASNO